ncbi:MAG TPA: endolytic transglycosylase MltG [Candidatus Acidoferrales bacterium]|nr:endolytic transglycosylase MltG [Candidatus Acidoferrales bacterium]
MRRAFLFLLILAMLAAGYLYLALYQPYQGFASGGVYVDIPRGASQRTISRLLDENGVVRSRIAFELLCRERGRSTLQAGEYFFDRPVTSFAVYDAIVNGRVFVKEFVIPEGFTMFDIADQAAQEGFLSRDEFLVAARDPSPIRDIAPDAPSLEGFLFPATYEFPRHMTGKDMTAAMVKKFRQEWLTLPDIGPTPHQSIQEIVTLASLVERETPRPEERPHVAGVFENRLRIGQPLQCDPTVAYALTLAGAYSGKLDGGDLHFASPYNTYRNRGLPPGPIANPGEAALRAALDPPPTEDLYFVANTEGGHFFSKTLQEHNRNVARYRQLLEESRNPSTGGLSPAPAPAVQKSRPVRTSP